MYKLVNNLKFSKESGFTLAELLVTLTVIGVVAILTIPALIANMGDASYSTAWKSTYSKFSAATRLIVKDKIDIDLTSNTTVRSDFETVMNYVKKDTTQNLFAASYVGYKSTSSLFNAAASAQPAVLLSDGILITFNGTYPNCDHTQGSLSTICARIEFDINGTKTPNMYGKDMQVAWIIKKSGTYLLVPAGSNSDANTCTAGSVALNTSIGCSTFALKDALP